MISYVIASIVLLVFSLFIHDLSLRFQKHLNEIKMHDRYFSLIMLLQNHYDKIKIKTHYSGLSIKLVLTHTGGTTFFFLIQSFGVLGVEWQEENLKFKKNKLEWYYSEKANQESIYKQILKDIHDFKKNTHTKINSVNENPNIQLLKNSILLSTTNEIEIGDLYNMAWIYMKSLDNILPLSVEGKFEVLAYNCISIAVHIDGIGKEADYIEQNFITLLIFYLKQHNLINSIHDLSAFINYRINLYATHLDGIKITPIQSSAILFKLFYIFPLSNKIRLQSPHPPIPTNFISCVTSMNSELLKECESYIYSKQGSKKKQNLINFHS